MSAEKRNVKNRLNTSKSCPVGIYNASSQLAQSIIFRSNAINNSKHASRRDLNPERAAFIALVRPGCHLTSRAVTIANLAMDCLRQRFGIGKRHISESDS